MKDLMGLMKQAKQMQAKMQEAQESVAALEVTGQSGAGMVEVGLTGEHNMTRLKIDPKVMVNPEDIEIVEDLIVAAYQDAKAKLSVAQAESMKSVMGDMELPPGMKMPF
jgi:DNA-binding YbaB/EbfC family protein